jgi:hypothetical protein
VRGAEIGCPEKLSAVDEVRVRTPPPTTAGDGGGSKVGNRKKLTQTKY